MLASQRITDEATGLTSPLRLPFVQRRASGLNYWAVSSTGHYASDCALGRHYADTLCEHVAEGGSPGALAHVVAEMRANGNRNSGVEIGFFTRLAERAAGA